MSVAVFGGLASVNDYILFITRSVIITFSTKSVWFIWYSPLCLYFSLLLFKYLITKKKVAFNNKTGGLFVIIGMLGFVFTLFFSFYVEFKLKNENYITCSKSSWMAPNKYVKDISLCK
ncbi:Putative membrane protein (fragment) [Xenorhabdus nematophila ATCC 19061]|uniref:Membrane protein n=1 Tax=Xenorhabdus nematophila (strain ATCC 19061 / DSM 3370 / CCUG 14189 / LMG 1036 / NCIMB 9965 / AN6) TaxID=406817 RepID=D3VJJ1_XENNA